MTKIKRLDRSAAQDNIVILCLCIILFKQMLYYLSDSWTVVHDKMFILGGMAGTVLLFISLFGKKQKSTEIKLLVMFVFWLIITRFMNRDVNLLRSIEHLNIVIVCVATVYCGMVMDKDSRKKALNIISVLVCSICFVLAVVGIYVAIVRVNVSLPLDITVGLHDEENGHLYITVLRANRNLSSMWFLLCFCFVLYQMSICKNKLLHIPMILVAISYYIFASLTKSRGTMIAFSCVLAMLVMLFVDKKANKAKMPVRLAVLIAVAIVISPLAYKSYTWVGEGIDAIHIAVAANDSVNLDKSDTDENASFDESNEDADKVSSDGKTSFDDYRDAENVMTLTGRTDIWISGLKALCYEPQRLIWGGLVEGGEYMYMTNWINKVVKLYMHNYLLDILMISGLPGFFLMLAFSLLLVVRMIKVFFNEHAEFFVKLLTLPLAASLIKNMIEANIFRLDDISNTLFCFIAGVFLAYSYELLPGKKAENETSLPSEY